MTLEGFDAVMEGVLKDWHVPGMAILGIKGGEVVISKGYGVIDIDDPKPVDEETLFAIGSCTKAFTTMGLALLVEDGKLDWDTPIREYMPDFRLYDEVATTQMTARDLTSHVSGLPRHDLAWYGSPRSREELFHALRYLKPTHPFRYTYQYQNLMYMTAGYLIEVLSGQTWEDFTKERIFKPLGMDASNLSTNDCEAHANAARPHRIKDDDTAERIPYRNLDAVGPAGSINSNLVDMAKWLRVHMNGGKHNDEQFVSAENLAMMHAPHAIMPVTPQMAMLSFEEIKYPSYGLGWATQVYRGHIIVRHTGGIDGFITQVFFLPDHDIGIVVFNNGGTALSMAASYLLLDRLLGLEPIDWSERHLSLEAKAKEMAEEGKQKAIDDRQDGPPSHAIAAYAGTYEHPGYGTLTISEADDGLELTFNGMTSTVSHHHYDVFTITNDDLDIFMFGQFANDLQGNIKSVSIKMEPTGDPIEFVKEKTEEPEAAEAS